MACFSWRLEEASHQAKVVKFLLTLRRRLGSLLTLLVEGLLLIRHRTQAKTTIAS